MFKSWKTTLAGIITFIAAVSTQINTLLDADPLTNPEWSLIITAFIAMLGLGAARDNDVTSKEAGAEK